MAIAKTIDVQLTLDNSKTTFDGPTAYAKITAEIIAATK